MKIFVTGGSGFIGSNFVLSQCNSTKNDILNFDKLTYAGNPANLLSLEMSSNYQFVQGDICDYEAVNNAIHDFSPDSIVHFAAESHVDRSIEGPMDFINTNILGTVILLEVASKYFKLNNDPSFRFLHISTDEVFGSLDDHGFFNEESPNYLHD